MKMENEDTRKECDNEVIVCADSCISIINGVSNGDRDNAIEKLIQLRNEYKGLGWVAGKINNEETALFIALLSLNDADPSSKEAKKMAESLQPSNEVMYRIYSMGCSIVGASTNTKELQAPISIKT